MYNNPYVRSYNQQNMYDQIDNQINQLQQMREQMKNNANQQPAINQTFQLAPNNLGGLRYFNTIDEVDKEMVYSDTPFFSKDMSVLWLKNNKGDIKTYELKEIVPLDDKDLQIKYLQARIDKLEGMIKDEQPITNANTEQSTTNTSTNDDTIGTTIEKSKPTSVQKVSGSKKK
jgi:hypothetical protein